MSMLEKLKSLFKAIGAERFSAEFPSNEYDSSLEAIESVLTKLYELREEQMWATFTAKSPEGKEHMVQVEEGEVNTLREKVDIDAVLAAGGMQSLVGKAVERDKCLYDFGRESPATMAKIVEAIFVHHFGLERNYPVFGELED